MCLTFAALAAGPVPAVNESHYWTKAKSFWDPTYGSRDLFLQSADAHYVFYLTLGLLAAPLSLPWAVWVARWLVWGAMAIGWTRLSRTLSRPFGVAILSGGLLVVLTRWFHLAGEWVVGGAEAKGLAFACVFMAIADACQRKWATAWIWGGAAAAFHVLVGGWVVLAMLGTAVAMRWHWAGRRSDRDDSTQAPASIKRAWLGLAVGGGLSLAGLLPALWLNHDVPAQVAQAGARIYSIDRLSHHLAIWAFDPFHLLAFASLTLVWLMLAHALLSHARSYANRQSYAATVVIGVSLGSLLIATAGVLIGIVVLESRFTWQPGIQLLRFYWFRCSDFMIPAFVALAPFALLYPNSLAPPTEVRMTNRRANWGRGLCLIAAILIIVEGSFYWTTIRRDPRPEADRNSLPGNMAVDKAWEYYQNWKKVCFWIREHTEQDALFLTPRSQQTFKWYSGGRSEVVCWKDVPQDSRSMMEWRQRAMDCFPHTNTEWGFAINQPEALRGVIEKYEVDYLLIPQYAYELKDRFGRPLPYPMIYPESPDVRSTFVVLDVREVGQSRSDAVIGQGTRTN